MMKIFISDAVVSKGYDGAPAIRFFNSENGGGFAGFPGGKRFLTANMIAVRRTITGGST